MSSCDPAGPRVSFRRVVLLLLLGATACMALTDPGRWMAQKFLPRRHGLVCAPIMLPMAPQTPRERAVYGERLRLAFEPGDGNALPEPTEELVAQRAASLEGWSSCVLLPTGSTPQAVEDAGIADRELCVALANLSGRRWQGRHEDDPDSPWRFWVIVLLDAQQRSLGLSCFFAMRSDFELIDAAEHIYARRPGRPAELAPPPVLVFHRSESGAVVRG